MYVEVEVVVVAMRWWYICMHINWKYNNRVGSKNKKLRYVESVYGFMCCQL